MARYFLYGMFCHPPLLRVVLGRDASTTPARLPRHRVVRAPEGSCPLIVPAPAAQAEGLLIEASAEEAGRLDYLAGAFGLGPRTADVTDAAGAVRRARVHFPFATATAAAAQGPAFSLADWAARWGAATTRAAGEAMALHGRIDAGALARRWPMAMARAASALRAEAEDAPAGLRRSPAPGDIAVDSAAYPYAGFFAVEEAELRFRRFDGAMSAPVRRAGFVMSDAVTVLPYDPARDRVLVVEQFRAGPWMRGDPNPWTIEPVAGRIDPGEDAEQAARRETREEAGLELGRLEALPAHYPSPGAVTEFLYCYVGLADLPDEAAGIGGLDGEGEDIRGHLLDFAALMAAIEGGAVRNGPLILSALWLAGARERLRTG
ncbi:tellurium resistance protein [Rhodobacteraceae bacterium WD3A24]|nr:tellurium resistance protein [Rhodobacteraceae bacterium WD3A24]